MLVSPIITTDYHDLHIWETQEESYEYARAGANHSTQGHGAQAQTDSTDQNAHIRTRGWCLCGKV
jgi:hypothetical protein